MLKDSAQKLDHRQYEPRESVLDVLRVGVDPTGERRRELCELALERRHGVGRYVYPGRAPADDRPARTACGALATVLVGHGLTRWVWSRSCRAPMAPR